MKSTASRSAMVRTGGEGSRHSSVPAISRATLNALNSPPKLSSAARSSDRLHKLQPSAPLAGQAVCNSHYTAWQVGNGTHNNILISSAVWEAARQPEEGNSRHEVFLSKHLQKNERLIGKVMDETISWGKLTSLFARCFKSLPPSHPKTQSALWFTPQGTGNLAPILQEYIIEGKSVGFGG